MFVGDITPTGIVQAGHEKDGTPQINSNVAIELGYALGTISEDNVLAVLNTAFGDFKDLPFDIQGKDGIILYNLPAGATKEAIKQEAKRFTAVLVDALTPFVNAGQSTEPSKPFEETPASEYSPSFFHNPVERLAEVNGLREQIAYVMDYQPAFHLRVIPTHERPIPLAVEHLYKNYSPSGRVHRP